jgi:hypothetical protein
MDPMNMKTKITSLLICTVFLMSIFPGITTAKNLESTSVAPSTVGLRGDLLKITDDVAVADLDSNYVVYADVSTLHLYNIKTGETENVFVGGNIVFPKISEERVVYYDFNYMGFKMYDISTGEKTDLIVTNWQGGDADDYQFYGEYIVYENTDYDQYSTEIFLYNITTGETIQLTDTPGDAFPENPCIFKNIVAWQLNEGPLADIVMYDIDSTTYTRVTNTSPFASETYPSIDENMIVYSYFYYDKLNGTILYGLKMYDIATEDETTLFTSVDPTGGTPEIFGDVIVYSVMGNSLNLYTISTHENTTLYEGEYLTTPWNVNEQYVLFTLLHGGIYLYAMNNTPPAPPEITGPAKGKIKEPVAYTFMTTDPDGHQVSYFIDWGDTANSSWIGPYSSGESVNVSHTWLEKGDYTIKAKARDVFGAESDWGTLTVTMPLNYELPHLRFVEWLFARFPHAFPILRQLLGY